jgi:hypothetical protein
MDYPSFYDAANPKDSEMKELRKQSIQMKGDGQ